jgi:hypothetical protein
VDWIGLTQDRNRWRALVNSVLNVWVPWNAGKLLSGLATGGLSSSAWLHRVSILLHCVTLCSTFAICVQLRLMFTHFLFRCYLYCKSLHGLAQLAIIRCTSCDEAVCCSAIGLFWLS